MAKRQSNIDTPSTTESGGIGFLRDNVRTLGIIGIVLLVVVAGLFYFNYSRGKNNAQALIELGRIRPYYDRGEFMVAISGDSSKMINGEKVRGLRYVVDEYKSSPAGKIAALFLGNCYLGLSQPAKAGEPFEIAAGADDPLVTSAAHAGLAAVAEASGKYDDAAQQYAKAASEDRLEVNTPQYLIDAARNYERAGKPDDAKENYRKVATQFPQSPANAQARMALARYKVEL
jgi:tetratricopeptide (TPR) repeat protein